MQIHEYQIQASKTDQVVDDEHSVIVPLLGLAGEVGTLLSEYKKYLRDGTAHQRFEEQVAEEIGDLLWYVANVATKFNLDLDDVAKANIEKTKSRWHDRVSNGTLFHSQGGHLLDNEYPPSEQLPREFTIEIRDVTVEGTSYVVTSLDGTQIGNELTDNAYEDDGYRFHDVFHLSYAAVLGWSPIIRKLLGRKRKSNVDVDQVEDGARAGIIEELISQLVFAYAQEHNFLDGVKRLDYHLLKTIQSLVQDREAKHCSLADWEKAIFAGYDVWRQIRANKGGVVTVNLLDRRISFGKVEKEIGELITKEENP